MSTNAEITPSYLFTRGAITQESTDFLVGRQEIVTSIANRLAEDIVSAVIYGMRGVGKTTIAWQVVSVLLGSNSLFPKSETILYNPNIEFDVVFHKCTSLTNSVGDLLVDVIMSGTESYSFSAQFSKLLSKKTDTLETIQDKFGVKLFGMIKAESTRNHKFTTTSEEAIKLLSDETKKVRFFFELVRAVREESGQRRLLIVLDEMERLNFPKGLGDFIKDVDNVQFLFVGIGETVSSIIKDHASAARKLAGNDFEAPPLSENEIAEIFKKAEQRSNGKLHMHDDFVKQAIEFSGGVPWIAQHVGYQAVMTKQTIARSTTENVEIYGKDFSLALQTVISIHRHDLDVETKVQKLDAFGATEYVLLQIFWDHPNGITEAEARSKLESNYKQFFDKALERVEKAGLISRRNQSLYFADPVLRLFVKFKIDEKKNAAS